MRKVLAIVSAAVLLGAVALAIAALAGATPGKNKSSKADRVLFALLKGRNEIGTDGRKGAGDPDGRGGFTALIANNQVCFGLTVDNIAQPIAAHIHRGRPSQNGPIVVTLAQLPGSGDPGASGGCVPPDGGNTAVLEEILKHPNRFYANVHTGDFTGGAIRGQLKHRRP
jgi:CHRD domain